LVVLDFDLSWHRGAEEKSVAYSTAIGYLAPEQIAPVAGSSTRSAAVDAFGIGMTLLFLCRGTDPVPEEHRHVDFDASVRRATEALPNPEWRSLTRRFARLILAATQHKQSDRWDLSEMLGEVDGLLNA